MVQPLEGFWQCYRGLVERCNTEKQNSNLIFYFGVTNFKLLGLFKRLGTIDLGRIPVYLGFLDVTETLKKISVPYPLSLLGWLLQPVIGLRIGRKYMMPLDIRHIKRFDNSFDELW